MAESYDQINNDLHNKSTILNENIHSNIINKDIYYVNNLYFSANERVVEQFVSELNERINTELRTIKSVSAAQEVEDDINDCVKNDLSFAYTDQLNSLLENHISYFCDRCIDIVSKNNNIEENEQKEAEDVLEDNWSIFDADFSKVFSNVEIDGELTKHGIALNAKRSINTLWHIIKDPINICLYIIGVGLLLLRITLRTEYSVREITPLEFKEYHPFVDVPYFGKYELEKNLEDLIPSDIWNIKIDIPDVFLKAVLITGLAILALAFAQTIIHMIGANRKYFLEYRDNIADSAIRSISVGKLKEQLNMQLEAIEQQIKQNIDKEYIYK